MFLMPKDKRLQHLANKLPRVSLYEKGDKTRLAMTFADATAEMEVDDRLYNSCETDYHQMVANTLMYGLFGKLKYPIEDDEVEFDILSRPAKEVVSFVAKVKDDSGMLTAMMNDEAHGKARKSVLSALEKALNSDT